MRFLKEHYPLLILLVLALATRFLFLWYPSEVVFDEVHFGKFVSAYSTGKYYFDIHPPLGKLMIAGFGKIMGVQPGAAFERIGEKADQKELLVLRFLPALFGVLLVLLIYQLAQALGASKRAAFLAGFLVLFDNAFLVEAKFILVDTFLLVFGFSAILFFLLARKQVLFWRQTILYILAAVFAGLSFSIKWTGLAFWGVIVAFIIFDTLADFFRKHRLPLHTSMLKGMARLLIFCVVPFLVYLLAFVVHFQALSLSGPGDAFMSVDFQKTLSGNQISQEIKPLPFWSKFRELNEKMYFYNSTLKSNHSDASKWYQWPLGRNSVWYWHEVDGDIVGNIHLLANPVVLFATLLGVFWGIWKLLRERKYAIFLLIFGYFASLLPFMFVSRVAFLYHYLPALTFAILLFSLISDRFFEKRSPRLYFRFLGLILLVFLIISPLSYGFPMSRVESNYYRLLVQLFH